MDPGHKSGGRFPWRHYWKVTALYFLLLSVTAGLLYYAMMVLNFMWLVVFCALLALVMGYLHVRRGKYGEVDEAAEELI